MTLLKQKELHQRETINGQELSKIEYCKVQGVNYISIPEQTIFTNISLGLYAQRILKVVISLIQKGDHPHKIYRFKMEDFCKTFNLQSYKIHHHLSNGFQELKNSFPLPIGNGCIVNWISYGQIYNNEIFIKLNPIIHKLYQEELQVSFELNSVKNFKNRYSFRFYELFCFTLGKREETVIEMSVTTLKDWLNIETKYQSFNDLRKRILEPVIGEINASLMQIGSSLKITFKVETKPKNVIKFHIERNKKSKKFKLSEIKTGEFLFTETPKTLH